MNHYCCQTQPLLQHKQRYNPTFVHELIFQKQHVQAAQTRCTPTFYSTAFDTQGYNIPTIHFKKEIIYQEPKQNLQKSIYCNYSHERRIQNLNPRNYVFYSSKDKWYDHTKQQMISSIRNYGCKNYPKQRKYIDLSSDPIFTDFNYECKNLDDTKQIMQVQPYTKRQTLQKQTVYQRQCHHKNPQNPQNKESQKPKISQQQSKQLKQNKLNKKCIEKDQKTTKKNFHQSCIPQNKKLNVWKEKSIRKRPQSQEKGKVVCNNPTFTVVRGNKICNQF